MTLRKSILLSLAGLFLVAGGCAPKFVGTGAGVYSGGKLYAASASDMTKVYEATLQTMAELGVTVDYKMSDDFGATVVGYGADGGRVTVKIEPGANNTSDFSIQVGAFGEEARSKIIYATIKKNLGEM